MVMAAQLQGLTSHERAQLVSTFQRKVEQASRDGRLQILDPGRCDPKKAGSNRHSHTFLIRETTTDASDVPVHHLECEDKSCSGSALMFETEAVRRIRVRR